MNPLLRRLLEYASRSGRGIGSFYAPRNVGVHHTLYGAGLDAPWYPTWSTPYVKPSSAATGQFGATAADQIPGFSYFWDAAGAGGANRAANQAVGQTALQFDRVMLEPATQGVGKITTSPRFSAIPDPNLPNSSARMVYGPSGQRVVGEVVSEAGPLTAENANEIARIVNRQKAIEATRSASKVAATAAAVNPGFWRSVVDAFLSDPVSSTERMEEQRETGNKAGAAGTYLGSLAQGPSGMALSAFLSGNIPSQNERSLGAQSARYQGLADAYSTTGKTNVPKRRATPVRGETSIPKTRTVAKATSDVKNVNRRGDSWNRYL